MNEDSVIAGEVSDIIDGETIYIEPLHDGENRDRQYAARELVHINRIKLDDVVWVTGRYNRKLLETILWNRKVMCRIKSREIGGAIVADVCLAEGYKWQRRGGEDRR